MAIDGRQRAYDRIARLSRQGLDLVELWRQCKEPLSTAVPHYWAPCFFTLDPASLLITSHFDEGIPELPPEWLEHEYLDDDVHRLVDIAWSAEGVSTLHEATGGDPSGSPRWQRNVSLGGDQELLLALRTRSGDVWGALALYREAGRPHFDEADKDFLRSVAPCLAEGARRALLLGEAADPDVPQAPGMIVLDADLRLESMTPGAQRWLDELPDGSWQSGRLPSAVTAVAARAAAGTGEHDGSLGEPAMARVLSRSGAWLVLHAAP